MKLEVKKVRQALLKAKLKKVASHQAYLQRRWKAELKEIQEKHKARAAQIARWQSYEGWKKDNDHWINDGADTREIDRMLSLLDLVTEDTIEERQFKGVLDLL